MTACKRAAELISLSQDTPLTRRQRLALAIHLLSCSLCRRFRRQMSLLQRAGRTLSEPGDDAAGLPAEARERIKRALRGQAPEGGR